MGSPIHEVPRRREAGDHPAGRAVVVAGAVTLAQLGIPRSTFYAWYERYLARGAGALEDGQPAPRRVWNKLPDTVAQAVVGLALKEPELSPRELAVSFIDQQHYFVSESSVYRLLKAPT